MTRGEVYWVHFPDPSTGSEISKTRPAVIVTAPSLLVRQRRAQVVPLTSNTTRVYPGEAMVTVRGRSSKALASQIATVDESRVLRPVGTLVDADLTAVEAALREQLAL